MFPSHLIGPVAKAAYDDPLSAVNQERQLLMAERHTLSERARARWSRGAAESEGRGREMDRRRFLVVTLFGVIALLVRHRVIRAAQATPDAAAANDLPALELTLTDTGFEIAQPLHAGRYQITVTNAGTSADSHFALGKVPDDITDAQYEAFLAAMDDTEDLSFEEIAFVGVPDWPAPGESASGVIDLEPGRHLLFDPCSGRAPETLMVEGDVGKAEEPAADLTVELREMEFVFPEMTFGSVPMR